MLSSLAPSRVLPMLLSALDVVEIKQGTIQVLTAWPLAQDNAQIDVSMAPAARMTLLGSLFVSGLTTLYVVSLLYMGHRGSRH